jgi:hypothetical protein
VCDQTKKDKRCETLDKKSCYVCGKENLNKNEIGLTKKLLDKNSKYFYCLDCLAEYLEVDTEFLLVKVEEFKEQGCILF